MKLSCARTLEENVTHTQCKKYPNLLCIGRCCSPAECSHNHFWQQFQNNLIAPLDSQYFMFPHVPASCTGLEIFRVIVSNLFPPISLGQLAREVNGKWPCWCWCYGDQQSHYPFIHPVGSPTFLSASNNKAELYNVLPKGKMKFAAVSHNVGSSCLLPVIVGWIYRWCKAGLYC